jgi:tetratricopeptide (TPR) repeat protein
MAVMGGGMAEACSNAAIVGESDIKFEQICTDALDNEMLNGRDTAGTLVNRGVMRLRRAEWGPAKRDFDKAAGIKPNLGEAYVNRGAALIGQRQYAASLPDINRGLTLGVDQPAKAYYNLALAYEGLQDAKLAYENYQKALEISPGWGAPQEQLLRFRVSHPAQGSEPVS